MNYVYRCMIVLGEDVDLARSIWATLSAEYSNEFRIALASQADPTVTTHWMSAGLITDTAAPLMPFAVWEQDENGDWTETSYDAGQPDVVAQMCRDADPPLAITDAEAEAAWSRADVTEQSVQQAFDRLGLTYTEVPV